MAVAKYDVGDRVRVHVEFRNDEGVAADPTGVTIRQKAPDGTVTSYIAGEAEEVVHLGTGSYYLDIDVDAAGQWYYRAEGTGAVTAAAEGEFVARATQFGEGD